MKIYITAFVLLIHTVCCCAEKQDNNRVLLPGKYYNGDGLGVNITIQLDSDGTYSSKWNGCLGNYGNSKGTWIANNDYLLFSPVNEDGMMENKLRRMKVIEYKDEIGFVDESELNEHKETMIEFGQSFYVYTLQKLSQSE